jgi:hypothetical protein
MIESPYHTAIGVGPLQCVPLTSENFDLIRVAAERSGSWLWAAYGPFLLSYTASRARAVLVCEYEGALIVLVRRKVRKQDHIDLMIPPLGDVSPGLLSTVVKHVSRFNGSDTDTRILWADLPLAAWGADMPGWTVTTYEREYIYDRDAILNMSGSDYRTLRKRVNRCEREVMPVVREYVPADHDACADLLREWQDVRESVVEPVFDFGYTMASLDVAEIAASKNMTGIVGEIDGAIRAFAFGGELRSGVGQFFILKSDPDIVGLAETTRVELLRRLEGCRYINDAGDLGREGLTQHKEMFCPVAFVPTWKMSYKPT